ncbi:hypothetical protein K8I85_19005, partial [bacterium]|nr:hypothetical protein [bacterium]
PGALRYLATREVRFGELGVGFGPPEAVGAEGEGEEPPAAETGGTRSFEMPELRAEGRAYLQGRWTLVPEGIACDDEEGGIAIVFEGSSVHAVVSPGEGEDGALVSVTVDGSGVDPDIAGADVEVRDDGASEVAVNRGRVYELVTGADFAVHNLDLRVRGRGATLHLLTFGTREVPEAS